MHGKRADDNGTAGRGRALFEAVGNISSRHALEFDSIRDINNVVRAYRRESTHADLANADALSQRHA